ncbi:carboxypeptidase-like regulatory domain-containing protein [Mucilaginibacter sp. HMF5004]|uniref:carboxypeptidase-like regulatory domain-containing protein n=1 Tax=Mucilaginibacter rivuli TaxID=2857527 RepID=UPI001C5CF4B5|nr:carboxypeptidase-like regulatory domain-containing protein [Mucilaginibacter rivuli]MBW4890370.1 carboxypeptidase-like regulatory domain-containing protein [Mucilaginibacter rivuli]
MRRLLFILMMLTTASVFAQQKAERPLVQFSGVVINADSSGVVPYVTITNLSYGKQINLANYKGYFSFVAHEQDTIRFTSIGYASATVVIPARLTEKSYTVQIKLSAAITHLPQVRIFPWATTDEFHKDLLSMKIADDDLEIARKNLSGASIAALNKTLPYDGQDKQGLNFQDQHNNVLNSHSITNPLLNPFAWGALIKEIMAGDKSRGVSSNY